MIAVVPRGLRYMAAGAFFFSIMSLMAKTAGGRIPTQEMVLARGAVNADNVVSEVMPLAEVDHAFKLLHGSGHMKILMDCQAV